jgi:hypothetical protein
MPIYDLRHIPTGEVEEHMVSIATMEGMVSSGDYEIVHNSVNKDNILSHQGGIMRETSSDWRNLLGKIKEGSGRSNTINTY